MLELFEDGVPPGAAEVSIKTVRLDGARQVFAMADRGGFLESAKPVPEPHEFTALVRICGHEFPVSFEEGHDPAHGAADRDNNIQAAIIHVMADVAVSVLVIVGLLLALAFGWLWMDPLAGIAGAFVIASWSWALVRDTGAILLDMVPDRSVARACARRSRLRAIGSPTCTCGARPGAPRGHRVGAHRTGAGPSSRGPGCLGSVRSRISRSRWSEHARSSVLLKGTGCWPEWTV